MRGAGDPDELVALPAVHSIPAAPEYPDSAVKPGDWRAAVDQRFLSIHLPADHESVSVPEFDIQVLVSGKVDPQAIDPYRDGADHGPAVLRNGLGETSRAAGGRDSDAGAHPGIFDLDRPRLVAEYLHKEGVLGRSGEGDGLVAPRAPIAVNAVPAAPGDLDAVVLTGGLCFAVDQRLAAVGLPADDEHFAVPEFDIQVGGGRELDG